MLLVAVLFGIVAGLRVFTGAGVWFFMTGNGAWKYLPAIAAIGEYIADALPQIPPRTQIIPSVALRCISGGFAGWLIAGRTGAPLIAAILAGIGGALLGTYGGYRLRMRLIARIGALPAALVEDAISIGIALFVVVYGTR